MWRSGSTMTAPSARSGDIFGDGQMLVVRTSEGRADSLGQLVGTEQTVGLNYLALAVNPLGLYGVEPRALLGQQAGDDPHPFLLALFESPVMLPDPAPHLAAYVPAGIVPDQHQNLLADGGQLLAAPLQKARGYTAHRTAVHKAQPRLFELGDVQSSVAGDGLRTLRSSFSTDCSTRRSGSPASPKLCKVGCATLLHQHSSSKPTTQSTLSSARCI